MSKIKVDPSLQMDSDSDEELENGVETSVDVGVIEVDDEDLEDEEFKLDKIHLRSPFFPSKLGGKPAWLDYSNLPISPSAVTEETKKRTNLKCNGCNTQLVFLLQIYAPITSEDKFANQIESIDDAFHRVIYVFLCSNTQCTNRSFKAIRSQINRENEFYSYEPPPTLENGDFDLKLSTDHLKTFYKNLYEKKNWSLCSACGVSASKKCARCSFAFFCNQSHQLLDWSKLNHKTLCPKYQSAGENVDELISHWIDDENSKVKYRKEKNDIAFPEYEIIIEPEYLDFKNTKDTKDKYNYKYDENKLAEDLEGNLALDQELDALKESDYDKDFEKFKKISGNFPTQIVRYERGGTPLWATKNMKLSDNNVQKCEYCGSKRIFEFQITPQLLCYLNLEEGKQLNSIDWAGLYVYTCVKSCKAGFNSYANEFIYKQDF